MVCAKDGRKASFCHNGTSHCVHLASFSHAAHKWSYYQMDNMSLHEIIHATKHRICLRLIPQSFASKAYLSCCFVLLWDLVGRHFDCESSIRLCNGFMMFHDNEVWRMILKWLLLLELISKCRGRWIAPWTWQLNLFAFACLQGLAASRWIRAKLPG